MKKSLTVAVVGCGQIADAHLRELQRLRGRLDVTAVCDSYEDVVYQAAVRFGIPHRYTNVEVLLAEQTPDIVHITTPPHSHRALVALALQAGSHVYVEKPFTPTVSEAEELVALAESRSRLVCLGHDQLLDPAWVRAREVVASGTLGDIVHVDAVQGYSFDGPFGQLLATDPSHWVHRLPGKVFQNVISHALARVLDVLPPGAVLASGEWFSCRADGLLGELRAYLRVGSSTAFLSFTGSAKPAQRVTRIVGTQSSIEVDMDARTVRRVPALSWPGPFAKIQGPWAEWRSAGANLGGNLGRFMRSDLHYFAGMRATFEAFADAIVAGRPAPITHAEALRLTRVMDDIFVACQSGAPTEGGGQP